MLTTKFINDCRDPMMDIPIPLQQFGNHKWVRIIPGRVFEFRNQSEKDIYAKWDYIRYTNKKKKNDEFDPGVSVEMHVRPGWKMPANPGLIMRLENFHGRTLSMTISGSNESLAMPYGMSLIIYNVDPFDDFAEISKIETTPIIIDYVFDPEEPGGRRRIERGGATKRTRRSIDELLKIKNVRAKKNQDLSFASEELIKLHEKEPVKKTKK